MSALFTPGVEKPEAKYVRLAELGASLGLPVLALHIHVATFSEQDVVSEEYVARSRTWNRNMWNMVFGIVCNIPTAAATFGEGYLGLKDASGVVYLYSPSNTNSLTSGYEHVFDTSGMSVDLNTAKAAANYGIWVGSGTTAESFEGYALATPIAYGAGNGQLNNAGLLSTVTTSYNATDKKWAAVNTRKLYNSGATDVTVQETAMFSPTCYCGSISGYYTFMVCRDILASPLTVLPGGRIEVTYTTTMTFPA